MARATLHGGSAARRGYYLSRSSWDVVQVERDGGLLPGGADEPYVRVPLLAMLLVMPALALGGRTRGAGEARRPPPRPPPGRLPDGLARRGEGEDGGAGG